MSSISLASYAGLKDRRSAFAVAQIFMSTLFIAICSHIIVHLPFTPVPLSLQTFAVMIVGAMLGSKKGALAVALYIVEALVGLPVLSRGEMGLVVLAGPTGGYILGFVAQAYLVGWFVERMHTLGKTLMMLGVFLSSALQLSMGAAWLGLFGYKQVMLMGVLPFVPGEILKMVVLVNFLTRKESSVS